MPNIGAAEIVIILVIALLVFGPKRLPEMGRSLGRGVREFKKATDTARKEFGVDEIERELKDVKSTLGDVKGGLKVDVDAELSKSKPGGGATAAAAGATAVASGAAATAAAPDDDVLVGEVVDYGSSDEVGAAPTGEAPVEEAVVEEAVVEEPIDVAAMTDDWEGPDVAGDAADGASGSAAEVAATDAAVDPAEA